jgi:hypothetical protein
MLKLFKLVIMFLMVVMSLFGDMNFAQLLPELLNVLNATNTY